MRFTAFVCVLLLPGLAAAQVWLDVTPPKPLGYLGDFRVEDVRVHSLLPERLLAITDGSVYVSGDGGGTWRAGDLCCVDQLFAHPARPGTVYAQLDYRYNRATLSLQGGELYRSDDFGVTWQIVLRPLQEGQPVAAPFASHPRDPAVLYATRRLNATYSFSLGAIPASNESVLESRDGGRTWRDVGPRLPGAGGPLDHPAGPLAQAEGPRPAAPERLFFTALDAVYVSRDGGRSWEVFAAPPKTRWIRGQSLDANVLYAYRESDMPSNRDAVLRSADGGATWQPIFVVSERVNYGIVPQLAIDPSEPRRLWLSGLAEGVFESEDGGETWTSMGLVAGYLPCSSCLHVRLLDVNSVARNLNFSAARPEVVYVVRSGRLLKRSFTPQTRRAVEYYVASQDRYWIATNGGEAEAIDHGASGPEPTRTGASFRLFNAPSMEGLAGACRFQGNAAAGIHSRFITLEGGECDAVKASPAWVVEGENEFFLAPPDAAGGCAGGLLPLRRFYNQRADVNHRYVLDASTAAQMRAKGWRDEGVVMCVPGTP